MKTIAFLLAVLLAGCTAGGGDTGAATDHVRAVVLPYLSIVPFHIAADQGFFAEQNLDVEFIHLGRNQEIMAAMATGDVDVAAGMLTVNELGLAATGARVRMVASLGTLPAAGCANAAIIARRELQEDGTLQDPERVRKLTFDISTLLPLGYWLDLLLARQDLSLDDVQLVDLPSPAAVAAMARGDIDVTVDSEPWITRHVQGGTGVVWASVGELAPDYVLSVMMYGPTLVDGRRDVGERFAVAILKALRQYAMGKTPRNLEIVERATGLDRETLAAACWPAAELDGRIDPATFRPYQEWAVARGHVDRVLEDDELFDSRFIDHANRVLAQ